MTTLNENYKQQDLKRGLKVRRMRESLLAYLLVLPAVIVTLAFGLYPVLLGLWQSLKKGRPLAINYVGLDNYTQATGSLIYVILILLSFAFFYLSYKSWKRIQLFKEQHPEDNPIVLLVPGILLAVGVLTSAYLLVVGGYQDALFKAGDIAIGMIWIPVVVIGVAGLIYAQLHAQFLSRFNFYMLNTFLMALLTMLGILILVYGYDQMIQDVTNARTIASSILNNQVGNAAPLVEVDDAVIVGAGVDGNVELDATIGNNVYAVEVAPRDFESIDFDELEGSATVTFSNNERVSVLVPLERGFGLPPITYEVDGQVKIEGGGSVISGGGDDVEATIEFGEDTAILVPFDIYVTDDVGQKIVARDGYMLPIERTLQGVLGLIIVIGLVTYISYRLSGWPDGKQEGLHTALLISRVILALIAVGLVAYIVTSVIFYRQGAEAMQSLTSEQFQQAYLLVNGELPAATLRPDGIAADLMLLPQVVLIATGFFLVYLAYIVWSNARHRETPLGTLGHVFVATALMVGGWMFISELPATFTLAGRDALDARDALVRTAIFSLGTVPPQLMLGLALAYALFYEINLGKGLFRLVYFMPYITPRIATAAIFTVIFSLEPTSLANQVLGFFGIDSLLWLKEPRGIVQIIYDILGGDDSHVPAILEGPTLALTTVILFNIWVYAGYNAVIFLAGLGSIPGELYEAAKVDGAGRWSAFRHITLPLLSPVTFFLTMLSIIGTFRAFGSVYVLQSQAAPKEVDTLTVRIFEELQDNSNPGYAASLAFILFAVIIVLTLTQNRLAKDRVFYG